MVNLMFDRQHRFGKKKTYEENSRFMG